MLFLWMINDWHLKIRHDAIAYFKIYSASIFFNFIYELTVGEGYFKNTIN